MDHFEKFENQLLSSYESTLAAEDREICEEIDSLIKDKHDELLIEKANAYCLFCKDSKRVDINENLVERCTKYISDCSNFRFFKSKFKCLSNERNKKKGLKNKILINI